MISSRSASAPPTRLFRTPRRDPPLHLVVRDDPAGGGVFLAAADGGHDLDVLRISSNPASVWELADGVEDGFFYRHRQSSFGSDFAWILPAHVGEARAGRDIAEWLTPGAGIDAKRQP